MRELAAPLPPLKSVDADAFQHNSTRIFSRTAPRTGKRPTGFILFCIVLFLYVGMKSFYFICLLIWLHTEVKCEPIYFC